MRKNIAPIIILGLLSTAAFAQIEQTRPELCGRDEANAPPLPPMAISVDQTEGSASLFLGKGFSGQAINLPGVFDSVPEVCPLPNGQYLVFGDTYNGMNMVLVDVGKRAVVDHIVGFEATMSPNQRWIIYRKFYPRHYEGSRSEEYLLYDLSKTPAQNRAPGIEVTNATDVGRAIFPVGRTNAMWDNEDLPDDRMHRPGSLSFYWAADSHMLVFGDILRDHFAVAAVTVNSDGSAEAFQRPVTIPQVCPDKSVSKDFGLIMTHAAIALVGQAEYVIKADFQPMPGICIPRNLDMRFPQDFKTATPEAAFEHHYNRKPAVVDQ